MYTYTKEESHLSHEDISVYRGVCKVKHEMHLHEFVELVYVTGGSGIQYIGGKEYKVRHGDLLFINYGQSHGFDTKNGFEFVNILINPVFISRELVNSENIEEIFVLSLFEEFGTPHDFSRQAVSFKGSELAQIDRAVEAMIEEFKEKKPGYKSALRGYLQIIFTLLLRGMSEMASISDSQNSAISKISDIPSDIAAYIEENCFDKITLADIAGMSFYNPAYFGRLLKKHYGKTFSAYIKERRMDKAAELLCDKGRTVDDVISAVGYTDRKLFYKHFKEYFGKTPSEYRK